LIVLPAIWLLVIGYGLFFVGYQNQAGKPTSFQDAFFGKSGDKLGVGGVGGAGAGAALSAPRGSLVTAKPPAISGGRNVL